MRPFLLIQEGKSFQRWDTQGEIETVYMREQNMGVVFDKHGKLLLPGSMVVIKERPDWMMVVEILDQKKIRVRDDNGRLICLPRMNVSVVMGVHRFNEGDLVQSALNNEIRGKILKFWTSPGSKRWAVIQTPKGDCVEMYDCLLPALQAQAISSLKKLVEEEVPIEELIPPEKPVTKKVSRFVFKRKSKC